MDPDLHIYTHHLWCCVYSIGETASPVDMLNRDRAGVQALVWLLHSKNKKNKKKRLDLDTYAIYLKKVQLVDSGLGCPIHFTYSCGFSLLYIYFF